MSHDIQIFDSLGWWNKKLTLWEDFWAYNDQEYSMSMRVDSSRGYLFRNFVESDEKTLQIWDTVVDCYGVPVDVLQNMQYVKINNGLFKGVVKKIHLDDTAWCTYVDIDGDRIIFYRPLPHNQIDVEGYIEFEKAPIELGAFDEVQKNFKNKK